MLFEIAPMDPSGQGCHGWYFVKDDEMSHESDSDILFL